LTSWSAATASGSIWNLPFSSQYTSRIGLAGPVTGGPGEAEGETDECELSEGELSFPLKNLIIVAVVPRILL
jgi:hypothetical protein